ncbi:MAG TPA: hypothetical protein PLQ45_02250 [Anaerohalosphaeraceae bacterium]|nr:hypothetical protein [Anaerohalosphaeraceae bacterium]
MAEAYRKEYLEAIELAESGRYDQALQKMQTYLKTHPTDGEALNDAGTILFCMNRGQEAIDYYLRARSCARGDIQAQVVYNLCEAYLAEGQPEKAMTLLKTMDSAQILNVDTVNRIAKSFVNKSAFGSAIEMLLYSLRLLPEQEILKPMLEIIRSKRMRLQLASDQPHRIEGLKQYLQSRFSLELCSGSEFSAGGIHSGKYTSIFVGCSDRITQAGWDGSAAIVFLDFEDLQDSRIEQIPWHQISALVVPSREVSEILLDRGVLASSVRVLTIPYCVDVESIPYTERKKGKRIAAIGPWTAHHNPMFLLQCMQKLHYLDADMRLHLAGEFEDPLVGRYIESMIEAMDLENVVFLDGTPKNLNRWLKDKHYIVSTAIDGRAMKGTLTGMAAGLRPLVHLFPGAGEWVEPEYLFALAEDFCRQILEGSYEPLRYRTMAIGRHSADQVYLPLLGVLSEIERRFSDSAVPPQTAPSEVQPVSPVISPSVLSTSPSMSPQYNPDLLRQAEPAPRPYHRPEPSSSSPDGSIEDIAKKALRAAQRLSELSKDAEYHAEPAAGYSERSQVAAPF